MTLRGKGLLPVLGVDMVNGPGKVFLIVRWVCNRKSSTFRTSLGSLRLIGRATGGTSVLRPVLPVINRSDTVHCGFDRAVLLSSGTTSLDLMHVQIESRKFRAGLVLGFLLGAATPNASAHHAINGNFDLDRDVFLAEAVLTEFKFVNPHVYLYLDVTDEQGAVTNWRCEMAAASRLRRRGWTGESLLPGQVMSIDGSPAWREDNVCHVGMIILEDGTTLSEYDGRPSADEVAGGLVAEDAARSRPAYLPNGQPNLRGPWVSTQASLDMPAVEPTPEGARVAEGRVRHFDSPALRCETVNIVYDWAFERESNDISQDDETITLQYGYVDLVRTIHLDLPEHPENIEPSVTGHSIGWWEDDTLVVDTIGFRAGVLEHLDWPRFRMHSDQWHVVERFRVSPDGRTLTRDYTFDDPLYMQESYTGQNTHSLTTEPYVPYACEDLGGLNNVRPEGE